MVIDKSLLHSKWLSGYSPAPNYAMMTWGADTIALPRALAWQPVNEQAFSCSKRSELFL
jgi:hypothetical protein